MTITLDQAIDERDAQHQWIDNHGGDEAGYIERYGNPGHDKCYGDGGTAIWEADQAVLMERIRVVAQIRAGALMGPITYEPPTDRYSVELVDRCAPRWAWEVIDLVLDGSIRTSGKSHHIDQRRAALKAMIAACEDGF